ncbi:transmembrane protein, putative [Bodo saltans]|uniref:Transmembrane protein, putative n=1 Tax=Bodo saltans TaxID=75058 RepID=A0A0S4IUG7_BODSA|nr:transmembrane protein, putative [Bodo saltans]|eukprot:CUG10645.1 transmembrane protein, putative [Bodo saltans]
MFKPKTKSTNLDTKQDTTRREFAAYVIDISKVQRNHIADRVERLAKHESSSWHYFTGCTFGSVGVTLGAFKLWGPRHIFKNSQYYLRPIPVALSMGFTLYGLFYTCRLMAMRSRIWTVIDDYEYELKRVKAHHVEEGVDQLAWLQFVSEQLRLGNERNFDIPKLRLA